MEESYSDGMYTHKIPVHNVIGEAYSLSNITLRLTDYNYNVEEIPLKDIIDGTIVLAEVIANNVTVSFHDNNQIGILDSGDYFLIEKLENNTMYTLSLEYNGESRDVFNYRNFLVSHGESIGNYPLITMDDPYRADDNISIRVSNIDVDYPKYDDLEFILEVPDEKILLSTDIGYENKMKVFDADSNITLSLNDQDDNDYFTKNDTVEIRGLEGGTEYTLKILSWYDFPLYELDGVA